MRAALLAFVFVCNLSMAAHAQLGTPRQDISRFMRVYGQSLPPYGFIQFCQLFRAHCRVAGATSRRFDADPARLAQLDQINRRVNASVQPATDQAVYGVEEFWTFPVTRGDCEDYVVLKRKLLMKKGWPASALLITVVQDELGEGHAVLTVRTVQGDFILDNKVNAVRLWNNTPYSYIMRQSYLDPQVWVSLDPRATATPEALAGLRGNR